MTILLVEDEKPISDNLKQGLEQAHYSVEPVYNGQEAMEKIEINTYDLIILDILLPGMDGYDVCKKTRKLNIKTPVLMLTCLETVPDRVKGLDAGADDYIPKPFSLDEILARVRALLRREKTLKTGKLKVKDLVLDPAAYRVSRHGKEISLTSTQYRILDYMMRRPNIVCTRIMIGEHVWGHLFDYNRTNVIDVHMNHLRNKINAGFKNKLIHTVPGRGYIIEIKKPFQAKSD